MDYNERRQIGLDSAVARSTTAMRTATSAPRGADMLGVQRGCGWPIWLRQPACCLRAPLMGEVDAIDISPAMLAWPNQARDRKVAIRTQSAGAAQFRLSA